MREVTAVYIMLQKHWHICELEIGHVPQIQQNPTYITNVLRDSQERKDYNALHQLITHESRTMTHSVNFLSLVSP